MITLMTLRDLGWPYSTVALVVSLFVAALVIWYLVKDKKNKDYGETCNT